VGDQGSNVVGAVEGLVWLIKVNDGVENLGSVQIVAHADSLLSSASAAHASLRASCSVSKIACENTGPSRALRAIDHFHPLHAGNVVTQ
jgi:hypothetical protein